MGNSLTLYEIAEQHAALVSALLEMELDETAIRDTIEGELLPFTEKATAVSFAIRNLESAAEQIKQAETAMAERRKQMEQRAEKIKSYLQSSMALAGVRKIETPHFSITIKTNPASVEIIQPELIPDEFMRVPPPPQAQPDKKAIKQAIEDGQIVPGCVLLNKERIEIK